MNMLLSILCSTAALIAYAITEKRINQRACAACGYRVSADAVDQTCPRCGALIDQTEIDQRRAASRP